MPDFFQIPFDDVGEGADLVAALSRQIASPRIDLRNIGPVDVGIVVRHSGADVYVSAGALTAIERAFARPPVVNQVDTVPDDVVWILRDDKRPFLGRGDVLSRIMPEPNEPLHSQRTSIGIVKFWRDDKGYGVIDTPETAPWGIWCSFGHIAPREGAAKPEFRSLTLGERVEVRYHRANQTSYKYVAIWVRRSAQPPE